MVGKAIFFPSSHISSHKLQISPTQLSPTLLTFLMMVKSWITSLHLTMNRASPSFLSSLLDEMISFPLLAFTTIVWAPEYLRFPFPSNSNETDDSDWKGLVEEESLWEEEEVLLVCCFGDLVDFENCFSDWVLLINKEGDRLWTLPSWSGKPVSSKERDKGVFPLTMVVVFNCPFTVFMKEVWIVFGLVSISSLPSNSAHSTNWSLWALIVACFLKVLLL